MNTDTGQLLRALLLTRPAYRRRWRARVDRGLRSEDLSHVAVAKVIAEYLWEAGLVADSEVNLPRRLKDRVSRAVGVDAYLVSGVTLRWFIEAFDMTETDAAALLDCSRLTDSAALVERGPGSRDSEPGWSG